MDCLFLNQLQVVLFLSTIPIVTLIITIAIRIAIAIALIRLCWF